MEISLSGATGLLCAAGSAIFAWAATKKAAEARRSADEANRSRLVTESFVQQQMEIAAKASADTRKALDIAEQSARTVRSLAEASQRAYLTLDALDVVQRDKDSGLPVMVRAEVRNAGKTPARSAITCQWVRHLKDLPIDPDYEGLESAVGAVLGPGSSDRVDALGPRLDAAVTQDLKRRKLVVFVYGLTRYQDLLGVAQQTRWAFYWNVDRQQFLRCPRHNDMT